MNRRHEDRQKRAEERLKEQVARTPEQQIARLNEMFGKGKGATKERARLAKLTKKSQKPKKS
jgi:hypothetical protein